MFHHSPGYFCCYYLLQVLQEDCGVKYNLARVLDPDFQNPNCWNPDFSDSRDLFIHGIIDGPGGTCASLPVIYIAVGRRLGYPLKLVETKGHLFFRWDDPAGERLGVPERFNIEGSGKGIGSHPDDYYRHWPHEWTEQDEEIGHSLQSLSPREELAQFLSTRGECLADNGRLQDAMQAYDWACTLTSGDPRYVWRINKLYHEWLDERRHIHEWQQLHDARPGHRPPVVVPHGASCTCWNCNDARAKNARRHQPPWHPVNCPCPMCEAPVGASTQSTFPDRITPHPIQENRHVLPVPGPLYLP
jgi:hypothetical protein